MFEFDFNPVNCISALTTPTRFARVSSQRHSNGTTKPIAFATNTVPNSSPRRLVEFSRSALKSNLDVLLSDGADTVIDLRCDAYGHGTDWVETAARAAGFTSFLTDDHPAIEIPPSAGTHYGTSAGDRVGIVSGEIVSIKTIDAGEPVSYGNTLIASRESSVGLVSLGFADGLPRAGSNLATMTVDESVVPVVGRIAMDQCVVDLTGLSTVIGSIARTWDSLDSVREWSAAANRDPLSLVSGLSWRVQRSWTA
jgi:alanine racemase